MAETKAKPKVDPQKFMGSKSTKGSGASMEGVDPKNINEVREHYSISIIH